jgi:hypothetical protein
MAGPDYRSLEPGESSKTPSSSRWKFSYPALILWLVQLSPLFHEGGQLFYLIDLAILPLPSVVSALRRLVRISIRFLSLHLWRCKRHPARLLSPVEMCELSELSELSPVC